VWVSAAAGFEADTRHSTGIDNWIKLRSPAPGGELAQLLDVVDTVAEIPPRYSIRSPGPKDH
jgi:hypothetical protein